MTTLLAKLIKKIESLPPETQDEIGQEILDDIENELRWRETLAHPKHKLEKLAEKVSRSKK